MDKNAIKGQVDHCLRNYPETRNSDVRLMIYIWRLFHSVGSTISVEQLYDLPREDSVKRFRAMLNAEGKYYPTDWKIAKRRGMEENKWREALGYPTKESTQNPTKVESYMDPQKPTLFRP